MGNKMYVSERKKDQLLFQEPVLTDRKRQYLIGSIFFFKAAHLNRKQHTLHKVHLDPSLVAHI